MLELHVLSPGFRTVELLNKITPHRPLGTLHVMLDRDYEGAYREHDDKTVCGYHLDRYERAERLVVHGGWDVWRQAQIDLDRAMVEATRRLRTGPPYRKGEITALQRVKRLCSNCLHDSDVRRHQPSERERRARQLGRAYLLQDSPNVGRWMMLLPSKVDAEMAELCGILAG